MAAVLPTNGLVADSKAFAALGSGLVNPEPSGFLLTTALAHMFAHIDPGAGDPQLSPEEAIKGRLSVAAFRHLLVSFLLLTRKHLLSVLQPSARRSLLFSLVSPAASRPLGRRRRRLRRSLRLKLQTKWKQPRFNGDVTVLLR